MSDAAAAADESQKAKKQCVVFEPQAWRKTLCRNCFKTKNDHATSGDADDQQKKPTSPVTPNDDYVVIPRREGTPLKDRSRSSTPTGSSTPATTPTATPSGKNILVPAHDNSKTSKDAPADKEKDKTINKKPSEVDKSNLSKASVTTPAKKSEGESETQKPDQSSAACVKDDKKSEGGTGKTLTVDSEQSADAKPAKAQQLTEAVLSQAAENNEAGNIRGHTSATEAPTSAAEPVAVDKAVNSSAAAAIESPDINGAAASASAADQPRDASRSESGHHGNASSPQLLEPIDIENMDEKTSGSTINTRGPAIDEHGSSSGSTGVRIDDASASAVTAATAAANAAISRSSATSDEIIAGEATSTGASQADDTKIDPGGGEPSAAAAGGMVGQDVVAGVAGAGCQVDAGLGEDAQPVRQLDLTSDQRADVRAAGVPGGLFTYGDAAANGADSGRSACASSISHATAVDESGGASIQQQSLRVDVCAASGNDSAPEVASYDSEAAGQAKVEATITLSGASSNGIDNSRPIHIVSAAGISGYQRGVWASEASQNVDSFAVVAEQSRLPPDYEQSSGYPSPSVGGDDAYGPTSPLVEYLARSPFARSLHGATERSPETEIVATGGGETSLFHHVPSASDIENTTAEVGVVEFVSDPRDFEAQQLRNGYAARAAADSDTDIRLNTTCIYMSNYYYYYYYPVPDTSGDGALFSIDFFVCLLARLRERLDRLA